MQKAKEEYHGYSDTNNILYVVYHHKRSSVFSCDHTIYSDPGFDVPYAKQMVSYSSRKLQRGNIFVPRVVQARLSGLQSRSLHSSADRRIKKSIQESRALDGYSSRLHTLK